MAWSKSIANRLLVSTPLPPRRNVVILPVVIPELEFRDIKGEIFAADLVVGADDAALKSAPKAFNRVGVDRAKNVYARIVVDGAMRDVGMGYRSGTCRARPS